MWISVGQSTRLFSPLFLCRRTCATSRRTLATMASKGTSVTLDTLKFVNGAIKQLPVDSVKENYVRTVQGEVAFDKGGVAVMKGLSRVPAKGKGLGTQRGCHSV